MCESMVEIQFATAENMWGKRRNHSCKI